MLSQVFDPREKFQKLSTNKVDNIIKVLELTEINDLLCIFETCDSSYEESTTDGKSLYDIKNDVIHKSFYLRVIP